MSDIENVKKRLLESDASLVVMYSDGRIGEYYSPRVKDIVSILKKDKNALNEAVVADRVIGKVAASLLIKAGVKKLYANVISEYAISVLEKYEVDYSYNEKVEYIINNEKTGMCPMENKFKEENDIQIIYNYFVENK